MTDAQDWTTGIAALFVDECLACGQRTALRQKHCPRCGGESLKAVPIEGAGRIWSITVVHRGPTKELTRDGPYGIALVDLAEGVRVMTRGDTDLMIGMPVWVALRTINGACVPYASRAGGPD